jgi:hypothetical protein
MSRRNWKTPQQAPQTENTETPKKKNLLTEEARQLLTEGSPVSPTRLLTEGIYDRSMAEKTGDAIIQCINEQLDDDRVVLDTYPFQDDIGYYLQTWIQENPDAIKAVFKPVIAELRVELPKKQTALQKRNRRV